jgi:general secretion pathway protein M
MSRFSALGLLIVVLLAVFIYGVVPLVEGYKNRGDEIVMLGKRLSTLNNLVENESAIDAALQDQNLSPAKDNIFIVGSNAAIASANLREFISDIVERSGGKLVSTQEYEAPSTKSEQALGLRFQFSGETDHFFQLLYQLETARPLVFIDRMTISSSAGRSSVRRTQSRGQRSARSVRSIRDSLTVKMDIYGYTLASGTGTP